MEIFSQGDLSTPKLQRLQTAEGGDEGSWEGSLNKTIQKLFKDMIRLCGLQHLTTSEFPHLKEVWHGQFPVQVDDEGPWEGSLNTTIQKIFKDMVGFRGIEKFTVSDFPHLKEVWHEKILVSNLKSLKSLVVDDNCCCLRNIFTSSVALGLVQLQKLEIKNCAILEMIAVVEEETVTNNLFPNLYELKLVNLPELSSFCNFAGNAIELPSLTHLWIENCPNMQTFICNFTGEDMSTSKDKRLTDIQPLFDEKIRLSNLECLRLEKMDTLRKIWHHQLGSNSFSKLVALGLHDCHNVLNVFPSNMFGRLQKLKGGLWITNCSSLYEIFELQASSCGKTQAITATQNLPILKVTECGNLKCLVPSSASFKNLTTLKVSKCDGLLNLVSKCQSVTDCSIKCDNLKNLVPSFVSFQNLKKLKVSHCDGLVNLMEVSVAKSLVQLTRLKISECKMIEEIIMHGVDEVENRMIFNQLEYLELHSLPKLTSFCSGNCNIEFPSLQQIVVRQCPTMEIFSQGDLSTPKLQRLLTAEGDDEGSWEGSLNKTIQKLFKDMIGFRGLQHLTTSEFPHLKEVWHDQFPVQVLCNLKSLVMDDCANISSAISGNLLQHLNSLEKLHVRNGDSLEEVFNLEELNADGDLRVLSQLSEFFLVDLPRLEHIWKKNHSEVLGFRNLKLMKVYNCSSLKYIFTPSVILGLMQLQKLKIKNCAIMEEIITMEGENDAVAIEKITFLQLNCLVMESLPNLTSFYSGSNTLGCPSLTNIKISGCPKMETFVFTHLKDICTGIAPLFSEKVELPTLASLELSSVASQTIWHNQLQPHSACFHHLTALTIFGCHNLKYLFPISVAESLNHLEVILIWNCMLMERVIITQGERKSSTLFPKLKQLILDDLPELTTFYNFNGNSIELPSLSGLIIRICPKMQTFASNSLLGIEESEEVNTETEENLPSFFDEKVVLPTLASIILSSIRIQTIWHNQLQPMSPYFQNLKTINMDGCDTVKHGFPSSMVESLVQLEILTISNCKLMEVIFEELNTTEDVETVPRFVFPQLTCLLLSDLPSLRSLSTGCLLKHGFPSVALGLVQLQKLEIKNCAILEVIAVIEEDTVTNNLFPNLYELKLVNLPELSSFCNFAGNEIELPCLTHLWIENCPNMQTFISNFTGEDMSTTKDKRLTDIQPFFDEKIRLSNLEWLRLQKMDKLREIWHHQLSSNSFSKLDALGLHDCHNVLTVFPSNMFGIRQKLKGGLWITNCSSLYEIFELQASSCGKTQAIIATQNLPILEVIKCGNLKCLVPSSASFKNLTKLEVSKCNGLLNLVAVPTAKSMMQLTKLSISECERIEEIIIHEGDEVEDIIIFKKLSCLELQCLPSLTSFYSGNYITEFPSLEQLVVRECPNIKTFSQGVLRAPRLDELQITEIAEGKGYWKGNLDTTIEHPFIEKGQSSKEY